MTELYLSSKRAIKLCAMNTAFLLLSACGGGSGPSNSTETNTNSWPTTGNYEVVLKPAGSSTATPLQTSLSLVHASTPDTEYQIDTSAAATQLGVSLNRGQWNLAKGQFTDLQNAAYVDHRNGTVRVTSLEANGARPKQWTANASNLCSTSQLARNFSIPFASQLIVDTAGADGACNTSDDGQIWVKFSETGAPIVLPISPENQFLGYLRSSTTGQPTDWLVAWKNGGQIDLWSIDRPVTAIVETGTSPNNSQFSSVANLSDLILYTQNGLLKAMRMVNGSPSISSVSALSGESGWRLAGNDTANAYVYFSSGASDSCTGTWRITSVARSAASADTLATGTGSLIAATTLNGAVYASVCSGNTGSLIKINTATKTQTVLRAPSSTVYLASSLSGELAITGISASTGNFSLSFMDTSDNLLYDAGRATFFGSNQAAYDASSNTFRGDSVYVVPQTLLTGTGGELRRWDVANKAIHTVGTLPSAGDLGGAVGNRVFTGPLSPSTLIGGTFVARLSSTNQFEAADSRVYTLLPKTDNSLLLTTKQVK